MVSTPNYFSTQRKLCRSSFRKNSSDILSHLPVKRIPLHCELIWGQLHNTQCWWGNRNDRGVDLMSHTLAAKQLYDYTGRERGHFCIDRWQGDMKKDVIDLIPALRHWSSSLHVSKSVQTRQTSILPTQLTEEYSVQIHSTKHNTDWEMNISLHLINCGRLNLRFFFPSPVAVCSQ